MKTNRERLLGDVLQDENYAAFRAALLEGSLHELHRTVRIRRRNHLLVLAAGVLLLAGLSVLVLPWHRTPEPKNFVGLVRSKPLAKGQIVTTSQLGANLGMEVVRTDAGAPGAELINDQQLLAAIPGERLGLVTLHSGKKQLVLFGPGMGVSFFDPSWSKP